MEYAYRPNGVCSRNITFELQDGKLHNVRFHGGCPGNTLGIAALVETHDEEEIRRAVSAGAKIIGVNNRNLKDFSVDFSNAARLRDRIPADCVYVAESGVKTPEDVQRLRQIGANAALIGETLMRAEDTAAKLQELIHNS